MVADGKDINSNILRQNTQFHAAIPMGRFNRDPELMLRENYWVVAFEGGESWSVRGGMTLVQAQTLFHMTDAGGLVGFVNVLSAQFCFCKGVYNPRR